MSTPESIKVIFYTPSYFFTRNAVYFKGVGGVAGDEL